MLRIKNADLPIFWRASLSKEDIPFFPPTHDDPFVFSVPVTKCIENFRHNICVLENTTILMNSKEIINVWIKFLESITTKYMIFNIREDFYGAIEYYCDGHTEIGGIDQVPVNFSNEYILSILTLNDDSFQSYGSMDIRNELLDTVVPYIPPRWFGDGKTFSANKTKVEELLNHLERNEVLTEYDHDCYYNSSLCALFGFYEKANDEEENASYPFIWESIKYLVSKEEILKKFKKNKRKYRYERIKNGVWSWLVFVAFVNILKKMSIYFF